MVLSKGLLFVGEAYRLTDLTEEFQSVPPVMIIQQVLAFNPFAVEQAGDNDCLCEEGRCCPLACRSGGGGGGHGGVQVKN